MGREFKNCQGFTKTWLVYFLTFDNLSACNAQKAPAMHQPTPIRTMKKLILITATFGFAAALSASAADGKTNWDTLCAKCHGADGKGQTKMGQKLGVKDFTDAKVQAEIKDDAAFKTIKEGKKDADGKILMKAFDTLSDEEAKALVAYVRGLK
jgi:cytochrome c553